MKNNDFFEKYKRLVNRLKTMGSVSVAFSGGVDSMLLLTAARNALGDNVLAIIADSPVFPENERSDAIQFLEQNRIRYLIVTPDLISNDLFVKNPENRCYICKKILFGEILKIAESEGFAEVVHGVNTDDLKDYRPGIAAAEEMGVTAPLAEAGFSKAGIRFMAEELNLPAANKPAMACLASRIPYDEMITKEKLRMIERAEQFLNSLGFIGIRVRHQGKTARIEMDEADFMNLIESGNRKRIISEFKEIGYLYICLDLEGYQQGSLNRDIL